MKAAAVDEPAAGGPIGDRSGGYRSADHAGDRILGAGAAGALIAALGSLSCCLLPLVLFSAGATGAWLGNLTALSPYQPVFIAAAAIFIGVGFWRVYRRAPEACHDGYCARPASRLIAKGALWGAALLVLSSIGFNFLAPYLLSAD